MFSFMSWVWCLTAGHWVLSLVVSMWGSSSHGESSISNPIKLDGVNILLHNSRLVIVLVDLYSVLRCINLNYISNCNFDGWSKYSSE